MSQERTIGSNRLIDGEILEQIEALPNGSVLFKDENGNIVFNTTSGGHTIQDEGVSTPDREVLDFVGESVTVTDDPINNKTIVTIDGNTNLSHTHIQSGLLNKWNITHNLGTTDIVFQAYGADNKPIEGCVEHVDENNACVFFTSPVSGKITFIAEGGIATNVGLGDLNFTQPLTNQTGGITLNHNLGKYPSVTVVDSDRDSVTTTNNYPDVNTVIISWIGDVTGFVTLN